MVAALSRLRCLIHRCSDREGMAELQMSLWNRQNIAAPSERHLADASGTTEVYIWGGWTSILSYNL